MTSRINTDSSDPLSILLDRFDRARPHTKKSGAYLYGFVRLSEGQPELMTLQRKNPIEDVSEHIEFMNSFSDEDNSVLFCAAQLHLLSDIDDVLGRYLDAFGAPLTWYDFKNKPLSSSHCLMGLKPTSILGYLANPNKKPPDLQVVDSNPDLERTAKTGKLKKAFDREEQDKMFAKFRKRFYLGEIKPLDNVFVYERDKSNALAGKFKNQTQVRCVFYNPTVEKSPAHGPCIKLAAETQKITPIATMSFSYSIATPLLEQDFNCHFARYLAERRYEAYLQSQMNHSLGTQYIMYETPMRGVVNNGDIERTEPKTGHLVPV